MNSNKCIICNSINKTFAPNLFMDVGKHMPRNILTNTLIDIAIYVCGHFKTSIKISRKISISGFIKSVDCTIKSRFKIRDNYNNKTHHDIAMAK